MACSYGGQALIEGVMMRGKRYQAMSARLEDGRIVSEVEEFTMLTDRHKFFGLPFIRGTFNMIDSLISGMKALTWSTNVSLAEDEEAEELTPMEIALTMLVSIGLGILLSTAYSGELLTKCLRRCCACGCVSAVFVSHQPHEGNSPGFSIPRCRT